MENNSNDKESDVDHGIRNIVVSVIIVFAFIALAIVVYHRCKYRGAGSIATIPPVHTPDIRQYHYQRTCTLVSETTSMEHPGRNSRWDFRSSQQDAMNISSTNEKEMLERHKLDHVLVEDIRELGRGSVSTVWLIKYCGVLYASKRLLQDQIREDTMQKLVAQTARNAKFYHQNIVAFVGIICPSPTVFHAIVEYMECGSLRTLLARDLIEPVWNEQKLRIAMDVAKALIYFHSLHPPFLYNDLKSRNVLLSADMTAKISGLNLPESNPIVSEKNTVRAETIRWLAPELLAGQSDCSKASDVYSFGAILCELDRHELPFFDAVNASGRPLTWSRLENQIASGGIKPTFSISCPKAIRRLIGDCLSCNPQDRPAANAVYRRLCEMSGVSANSRYE